MLTKILSAIIIFLPVGLLGYLAFSAIAGYWPEETEEDDDEDFKRRNGN